MSALYFKYQAFDAQGKMLNGQLSADTEREAVRILKGQEPNTGKDSGNQRSLPDDSSQANLSGGRIGFYQWPVHTGRGTRAHRQIATPVRGHYRIDGDA